MKTWEVLLVDGQVHVLIADEPAIGESVVRFWLQENGDVATYVLRNVIGWRSRSGRDDDLGGWPLR